MNDLDFLYLLGSSKAATKSIGYKFEEFEITTLFSLHCLFSNSLISVLTT